HKQIRAEQDEELLEELFGRVRRDIVLPVRQPGASLREPNGGSGAGYIPVQDDDDDDEDEDGELRAIARESMRTLEEDEQQRRGAGSSETSSFGRSTSRLFRRRSSCAFEVPEPQQDPMDPFVYRKRSVTQKTIK